MDLFGRLPFQRSPKDGNKAQHFRESATETIQMEQDIQTEQDIQMEQDMEDKKKAALAQMKAEMEAKKKQIRDTAKKELDEEKTEAAERLHEMSVKHANSLKEIIAKDDEEMQKLKYLEAESIDLSREQKDSIKKAQEARIEKRHQTDEEIKKKWSKFEEQKEEDAIHDMVEENEMKASAYIMLEEERKKGNERSKKYIEELKEETKNKVDDILRESIGRPL